MPIFTTHYRLAAFLSGDILSASLDKRRFSTIDTQLADIATLIGDGVISGWTLTQGSFPSINVSKGSGLIDGFYVSTDNDEALDVAGSGTSYVYAKRIIGTVGESSIPSELLSATQTDVTAPAVPTSFLALSPTDNASLPSAGMTISLTWDDNSEADLDHYNVYRSTDNVTFELLDTTESSTHIDETVVEDTSYFYRLSAEDQSGNESGFATDSVSTPLSDILPPNPVNFEIVPGDECFSLLWIEPEAVTVQSYDITCAMLESDDSVITSTEVSTTNSYGLKITDVVNGNKYRVTVQTVDSKGRSSEGVSLVTIPNRDSGPPDPINLSVSETGYSDGPKSVRLLFNWQPGTDEYEYELAAVANYRVYISIDGKNENTWSLPIETASGQLSLDLGAVPYSSGNVSIPENTIITARISSISTERFESTGSFLRFKTGTYGSTQTLRNVSGTYDIKSLKVAWQNNDDTEQIEIKVERQGTGAIHLVSLETFDRIWMFVVSKPDLGHTYYVSLTPINSRGQRGETTTVTQVTYTTAQLALPQKPTNLYLTTSYKTISVSWQLPGGDLTNLIEFYNLYRAPKRHSIKYSDYSLIDTFNSDVTSYIDYGLDDEQDYTYYLTSVDIFGRESKHLSSHYSNVGMVSAQTPAYSGEVTPVFNVLAIINNFDIILEWDTILGEPFVSFGIFRSIGDLHSFSQIASVDFVVGQDSYTYTDSDVALLNGQTYYYVIQKISSDSSIVVTTSSVAPDNSILLGSVVTSGTGFVSVSNTKRDIYQIRDSISDMMAPLILAHAHRGEFFATETKNGVTYISSTPNAELIDLNPFLVVTDWTTTDGKNFYTTEDISGGTDYLLKINGLFPSKLYEIDQEEKRITFAEPLLTYDPATATFLGTANLELKVLGIEEVTGILPNWRFDNLNAQQIGYGNLEMSQLPALNHQGRMNELLVPDRYELNRYDNYTFFVEDQNQDLTALFGDCTTFFCVTDEADEIDELEDFDTKTVGETYLFQNPNYSTTTSSNIDAGGTAGVSSDYSFSGSNSYKVTFSFADSDPCRWLQLTTAGFNPTIDLHKKLSVKLRVESGSFYFGLGVRKSYVSNPVIGQNGGTSFANGLEATTDFVGVSVSPQGCSSPLGKFLVTAEPGTWQSFEFDIPNENVLAFTGNGTLTTENGFAVLEHFNFTLNPDADDPTEEVILYIDDVVQVTDVLASGTNSGIRKSSDYGISWELSRYTETPISKFYKSSINGYLWGISSRKVYASRDVDHWFEVPGTKGIQIIRDITEDSEGNIYISTDRGVYLLDLTSFSTFSELVQCRPVCPFSTECYAIWRDGEAIRVSTEVACYSTTDKGQHWTETSLLPSNVYFYSVISTGTSFLAASKKKIYRKLAAESQFLEIANLPEQISTIEEIWKMIYFSGDIYLSTNDGAYKSTSQNFFEAGTPTTEFDRVFSSIDINNSPGILYSMDEIGTALFLGGENVLYSSDKNDLISTKYRAFGKEIPSIVVNDTLKNIGFTYSSFNGIVSFRESLAPTDVVKVDKLPRQIFHLDNNGFAQSNIFSFLQIRLNGVPKWVDFSLDQTTVTTFAETAQGALQDVSPLITEQNSFVPDDLLQKTISNTELILQGNVQYDASGNVLTTATMVNDRTVSEFLKNYSYMKTSVSSELASQLPVPVFTVNGIKRDDRITSDLYSYESINLSDLNYNNTLASIISYLDFKNAFYGGYLETELLSLFNYNDFSRTSTEGIAIYSVVNALNANKTTTTVKYGDLLEEQEGFTASDADGILVEPVTGTISFDQYSDSTDPAKRNRYSFSKEDRLTADLYGSTIGTGASLSHVQLEDEFELVNSGLPAQLANPAHGNLIKSGIFFERQYPYIFSSFPVQNIQSKYYPANRSDWYDVINSTIDYNLLIETSNTTPARIVFDSAWLDIDPYYPNSLWLCTDANILEYSIDAAGTLTFSRTIKPLGEDLPVRSIFVRNGTDIFVVCDDKILLSQNYGTTWTEADTTNLPPELYKIVICNDNLVAGTNDGIWWSGSDEDEFTRCTLSYSNLLTASERAEAQKGFVSTIQNLEVKNFLFLEAKLNFYLSNSGIEFMALGRLEMNDASVVNKLYYYKNTLWVATDKGLYSDGGSILSEKVAFGLQSINGTAYDSLVKINDITGSISETDTSNEALYVAAADGILYRYQNDAWCSFETSLPTIHKIHLVEAFANKYVVAIGYNQIEVVTVSVFDDTTQVEVIDVVPCDA